MAHNHILFKYMQGLVEEATSCEEATEQVIRATVTSLIARMRNDTGHMNPESEEYLHRFTREMGVEIDVRPEGYIQ